ncbi:protein naked cuticle homolog 2 [Rhynchocyon petersi]
MRTLVQTAGAGPEVAETETHFKGAKLPKWLLPLKSDFLGVNTMEMSSLTQKAFEADILSGRSILGGILVALASCVPALELPQEDPKDGTLSEDQGLLEADGNLLPLLTVVLPPERTEGREGPGLLCGEDGDHPASGSAGRKPLHINVGWGGPWGPPGVLASSKRTLSPSTTSQELQCDISVEEDNRQEWTFTLYDFDNSGKVTREDLASLMHTIYEIVDASVNHSSSSSKTLRVKLTVSPGPSGKSKESPPVGLADWESAHARTEGEQLEDMRAADRKASTSRRLVANAASCPIRGPYCVDENTERRNHYLDLAGIENYTSKFGPGSPPVQPKQDHHSKGSHPQVRSRSQESDSHAGHHHRSQVLAEPGEFAGRVLDALPRLKVPEKPFKSPKGAGKSSVGLGVSRSAKTFSYHLPVPPQGPQDGHQLPLQPPPPPPQPYGHKRSRQKSREGYSPLKATCTPPGTVGPEVMRDLPPMLAGEGFTVPVVQRHEHHHHHEHPS